MPSLKIQKVLDKKIVYLVSSFIQCQWAINKLVYYKWNGSVIKSGKNTKQYFVISARNAVSERKLIKNQNRRNSNDPNWINSFPNWFWCNQRAKPAHFGQLNEYKRNCQVTYPLDTVVEVIVAFLLSKLRSANRQTFLLVGHQLLAEKGRKLHAECWHTFKTGTQ